jgi:hypothetical protein
MANNRAKYGFRFYSSQNGSGRAAGFEGGVTSAYQANVGSGNVNVGVSIGDPVAYNAAGNFELAQDVTADRFYGVVVGIRNARVEANGKSRPVSYLPGAVTYTLEQDRTSLIVLPFGNNIWEVDADDAVTATTLAAYRLLVGLNADMIYTTDVTNTDKPRARPELDISTAAVTAALDFRIVGVSRSAENADFSGTGVKLLVQLNLGSDPALGVVGVVGL